MMATGLLAQAAAALLIHAIPAAGFAFQFTFGSCTLDTTTGTLVHERQPRVQVSLTLSEDQMTGIEASLDEFDFFAYPSTFVGVPLGLTAYSINAAARSYRMQVQRAERTHVVSWMDSTRPSTDEADRLRALFERIVGDIRSRPGYEQLVGQGRDCR